MTLFMPSPTSMPIAFVDTVLLREAGGSMVQKYRDSDATQMTIDQVEVGTTSYPLRQSLNATFVGGQLVAESLGPVFVGYGESREAALQDLILKIHASFQELIAKRPFEMNGDEQHRWDVLRELIDVTVYKNTTAVVERQFGKVTQVRPWPQEVEWDNGRKEAVLLRQVNSPDFITYKPGQPFEAVVERNPLTGELLRISHIERRRQILRMPPEQERQLVDAIGSSRQLETTQL